MTPEPEPAEPVKRRSRAPSAPTVRVASRCGAQDAGQSSGASALDLFRVALPQPVFPRPWLSRGTLGLLGSRAWREAASPKGARRRRGASRGRVRNLGPLWLPWTPTVTGGGGVLRGWAGGTGLSGGGAGTDQPGIQSGEVADSCCLSSLETW